MKTDEIRALFETSPFADRVGEIFGRAAPALRLNRFGTGLDSLVPGASRLGWLPDRPPAAPVGLERPLLRRRRRL